MQIDTVNDVIISGLDQILPMEQAQRDILGRVDEVIQYSISEGSPRKAFDAMRSLLGVGRISGLAASKFIYVFKSQWKNFNQSSSFDDAASDELGIGKVTVKRYFNVWEMLVSGDIPLEYRNKLMLFPIKSLIPIANLLAQGHEVENTDWLRLSNAPDLVSIGKIIRDIKGVEPKKGSLQIEWDEEGKVITGWKDGKPTNIYLTYNEDDPMVKVILERLLGDGKALEK